MCSDLTVAKGEFDEDISHPDSKVGQTCDSEFGHLLVAGKWLTRQAHLQVLKVGDFKVGLLHGHQVGRLESSLKQAVHIVQAGACMACSAMQGVACAR